MNTHTLTPTSTRWWWPSAAAAAVALTAVGAITVGPALFDDTSTPSDVPTEPDLSFVAPVRACIVGQPHWSSAVHALPLPCSQAERTPDMLDGIPGGARNPARELATP